jgi:hypothetical protein
MARFFLGAITAKSAAFEAWKGLAPGLGERAGADAISTGK